jgi:hypothetical protein
MEMADLVIAVWDGEPTRGKGGTADIVSYARDRGVHLVHLNPLDYSVTAR